MVKESEHSKAKTYKLPGKALVRQSISAIDEDYQMIDSQVDLAMKGKIENFEFIELSRLLPKTRGYFENDQQRLEIVNRNGVSYLSPVSERETLAISSYSRWEQTFRIYANILTKAYPFKATELYQYSHVIQLASVTYVWENVYAYDKEFRHHILHHPSRSWSVILQQAWTMLLKDRIKTSEPGVAKKKEPCRCFNKGKCTFGLSCHYEHCCSEKKCEKFGHGAFQCRVRQERLRVEQGESDFQRKNHDKHPK